MKLFVEIFYIAPFSVMKIYEEKLKNWTLELKANFQL